jgi:hypothetical protein
MIVKRKGHDKASECLTAEPSTGTVARRAPSPEYAEALNATVYMVVSIAMANAMVLGKKTSATKGAIFGQFNDEARARRFREDAHKRFAPVGKNLATGKQESMMVYTSAIVQVRNGEAEIIT